MHLFELELPRVLVKPQHFIGMKKHHITLHYTPTGENIVDRKRYIHLIPHILHEKVKFTYC